MNVPFTMCTWSAILNVDLTGITAITLLAGSEVDGNTVDIRLDSPDGECIGTVAFDATGTAEFKRYAENADYDAGVYHELVFAEFPADITPVDGVHDIYLVFGGADTRIGNISFAG